MSEAVSGDTLRRVLTQDCADDEEPTFTLTAPGRHPGLVVTYILSHARNRAVQLPTPDEFAELSAAPAGGCAR